MNITHTQRRLGKLMLPVLLLAGSLAARGQSDAVCLKALETGTTTFDSSSDVSQVAHLHHTFCRTKIERFDQAKQQSTEAGFTYYEVLEGNYKGNSLATQTRQYFEAYCNDLKNYAAQDASSKQKLRTANSKSVDLLRSCKKQAGFVSWVEHTADPRRFTVHFEYNPIPLIRNQPRLVFGKRDGDRAIQLRPADAFEGGGCSNEPTPGTELTVGFPRSISCVVKADWNGTSVTASAELTTGRWWNQDVVPALVHVDVPPIAPPEPDKPLPELVLVQHDNYNPMLNAPPPQESAPLGKWVTIDLGQFPSAPSEWRSWTTPSFTLRILDAGGTLSGENITGRMQMISWRDNDLWQTDKHDSSGPMQNILVERELSSANSATFVSMGNAAYNDKPDKKTRRSAGTVELDATKAQSIGMQAQFTDGDCLTDVMTTAPGGTTVSLPVGRLVRKCVLRMRLCTTDKHPRADKSNSCSAKIVDGFANTARSLGLAQ